MKFSLEASLTPFWAEGKDFTGGRDPLGIQNSSVSVYTALLPGLNNVTNRLRYYGFYCWLLQQMDDKGLPFSTPQAQYNYIRRAEYALALYMCWHEPEAQGVVGSDFAKRRLEEHEVNVALGADKNEDTVKGSVYWDFKSGALGQYYTGSLQNKWSGLGLLTLDKNGYYFLTDVGRKLANAFAKSISPEAGKAFLSIIERGRITKQAANAVADFSLSGIVPGSDEWQFYVNMFFSADFSLREEAIKPTYYRRDSLMLLMRYFNNGGNSIRFEGFTSHVYASKGFIGTELETVTSIGWFCYATNERVHFALECLFSTVLKCIEKGEILFTEAIMQLTSACLESFAEYYDGFSPELTVETLLEMIGEDDWDNYRRTIDSATSFSDCGEALVYALEYFLVTCKDNYIHIEAFHAFTTATGNTDKTGTALQWFDYTQKRGHLSVKQFVSGLIKKLINDHLHVAYAKLGSGDSQVHKLLVEENYLVHISNIEPRFTSPRLTTASTFLKDMKLIERGDRHLILTPEGKAILMTAKDEKA